MRKQTRAQRERQEARDRAIREARKFANRIRAAVLRPRRIKWRRGTESYCPLEAMLLPNGDDDPKSGSAKVSSTRQEFMVAEDYVAVLQADHADKLREAGFKVERDPWPANYKRWRIETPEEVAEFVRMADSNDLPDEIQGQW